MKILFLAFLTATTLGVAGCTIDQRIADPDTHKSSAYQNTSTNSYNAGTQDTSNPAHYAPGGYGAVGPDNSGVPNNPSALNPADPQSDRALLQK
jgi:hypothetical protein